MENSPFRRRELGVLLHPTSLCNREDIGTLGQAAFQFVDWLARAGITLWQILPLNRNGRHDSPYFSPSAFGGNPWLVDLESLRVHGLLDQPALHGEVRDHRVTFAELGRTKLPQLLFAADRMLADAHHPWRQDYDRFRSTQPWLKDTAHFFALKDASGGAPWWEWPAGVRAFLPEAIDQSRRALSTAVERQMALLFFFDQQWHALKSYANHRGVRILGDIPIYVDLDSADVWSHQQEFFLDASGRPTVVSGVPPDYFAQDGQLWGNPIYRWGLMEKGGFSWWMERLSRTLDLCDIVRIDHFRALSAYWEIQTPARDARLGRWVPGPGQAFWDVVRRRFPHMPFVAEDLGTLDHAVYELRDRNGLCGMRILQFGFDGTSDTTHQPHHFPTHSIVYTGTHDNDTLAGWWAGLRHETRVAVSRYYQFRFDEPVGRVVWSLIEAAIGSRACAAVIPLQDLLVLDSRARMNDPATFVGNWGWRAPGNALSPALNASVRQLREKYQR